MATVQECWVTLLHCPQQYAVSYTRYKKELDERKDLIK